MNIRKHFTLWLSKIMFKQLTPEAKTIFRKLEKNSIKLLNAKAHRLFNETCLNNNLLPTYTNIRLHDDVTRAERFVSDFRRNLIVHQIDEQRKVITSLTPLCHEQRNELKVLVDSDIRFEALMLFLQKILNTKKTLLDITHGNKLEKMYGSSICMKQEKAGVINLSNYVISDQLASIFDLGMNCHLRSKYDTLRKRIEVEKLYSQIKSEVTKGTLNIHNGEQLRTELKRFGLRDYGNFEKDLLDKEQYKAIKTLTSNKDIMVRRADKSNIFVLMNRNEYIEKLNVILADTNRFKKLSLDSTDNLKRTLNDLIELANAKSQSNVFAKLVGQYNAGYLYGNPKIHKSTTDPPLRPIISQVGTPTYTVAQKLNNILKEYMPAGHMINSTDEFIGILRSAGNVGLLASLDVDSLFVHVPVENTIDIIIKHAYSHQTLQPPKIPKSTQAA